MNLIRRIRSNERRLASAGGTAFLLLWLSLAAAPCALAMVAADTGHDCPHCPPAPCHEMQSDDCAYPESLDVPRAGDEIKLLFVALPSAYAGSFQAGPVRPQAVRNPSIIHAGPRTHLLFQRFDE